MGSQRVLITFHGRLLMPVALMFLCRRGYLLASLSQLGWELSWVAGSEACWVISRFIESGLQIGI